MNIFRAPLQQWIARSLVFTAALCIHLATLAQPAQTPLLTRSANVAPNLVLMFDDSTSMTQEVLYQETTATAWGGNQPNIGGDGVIPILVSDVYARCSPQINQIYYNPKLLYLPPYNSNGQRQAAASPPAQWEGVVCKDSNNNPILYRYTGNGPLWDQIHPLDVLSSYTPLTIQSSTASYPRSAARTDCKASTCSYAEELQNFANWYQWYRLRVDMARHALIEAFIDLQPNFRLGWGRINTLGKTTRIPNVSKSSVNGQLEEGVSLFDSNKRSKLIDFLAGITRYNLIAETPNRYALDTVGKYFQRTDADGPWGTNPTASSVGISTVPEDSTVNQEPSSKFASCRRANALLITDGYYNDADPPVGDVDNTSLPKITGPKRMSYEYIPSAPYKQNSSNSFADVAMKYWATDLNSNLINNIPSSGTDPAFWQHLNFWGITLGIDGTLVRNASTLDGLKAGTKQWPAPDITPGQIDDMWHATVNARGDMLTAGNSAQLKAAVNGMVGEILKISSTEAGVSASTLTLSSNTLKFVPAYTTGEWSGNISAYQLDAKNGNTATLVWQAETRDPTSGIETGNTLYPDLTVAFGNSRKAASRKIYVGTAAGNAAAFSFSPDVKNAMQAAFDGQVIDQTLIDYLRGDRSEEGPATTRQYRVRAALLGDVVNSTPTLVKPAIDYGYANLPAGTPGISTYASYLNSKAMRKEGVLFFGANDGMAHGLAENDGREVFAFVPRAVLPHIAKLADPNYSHRYFVDGPMTQGDFYSSGNTWKNVV
ncbi:MAG: PilC/PilY family type IV pilus protein, partial [Rhodoferax sp.]|nr:PilC/PilY family type IV pilus protein [Rhodoferax sp.]